MTKTFKTPDMVSHKITVKSDGSVELLTNGMINVFDTLDIAGEYLKHFHKMGA